MTMRFVVTGTDTNIGKTVFSAALADALGAAYWKPIQSGLSGETDSETVQRLGRIPPERIVPETWRLKTPASPHVSARIDNVRIDPEALSPPATESPLIIEGAGGVLVPLTESQVFADVFARWQIPGRLKVRVKSCHKALFSCHWRRFPDRRGSKFTAENVACSYFLVD